MNRNLSHEPLCQRDACAWLLDPLKAVHHLAQPRLFTLKLDPQALLFNHSSICFGVHLVCKGHIKLSNHTSHGKKRTFAIAGPGTLIGEAPAFNKDVYPFFAEAIGTSVVHFIERKDMVEVMSHDSDLMQEVLRLMAHSSVNLIQQMVNLSTHNKEKRMAFTLMQIAEHFGIHGEDGFDIGLPLTRAELGEMSGMSTETAIRTLRSFEKNGLVKLSHKRIVLCNKTELELLINR